MEGCWKGVNSEAVFLLKTKPGSVAIRRGSPAFNLMQKQGRAGGCCEESWEERLLFTSYSDIRPYPFPEERIPDDSARSDLYHVSSWMCFFIQKVSACDSDLFWRRALFPSKLAIFQLYWGCFEKAMAKNGGYADEVGRQVVPWK